MALSCFIRWRIDPLQREAFRLCAEAWARLVPRCGGELTGYFLPHEDSNDIAFGLVGVDHLAACERCRAAVQADAEARENLRFAASERFVPRERRGRLEDVPATRARPREAAP